MIYPEIDVQQLKQELEQWQILDVRTEDEFEVGHLASSIHIPLHQLGGRLKELDQNGKYAVICRSGHRSLQATQILLDAGIKEVANVQGGMNAWASKIDPSIKVA